MSGKSATPDATTTAMSLTARRAALADRHGVDPSELTFGNGSNEVLNIVARTFLSAGGNAVIFDYSFIAYRLILKAIGAPFKSVPVSATFQQSTDAMLEAIDDDTRLVIIANPNNPTGTHIGGDELRAFLQQVPSDVVVVIDEAYVQYASDSDFVSALEMRDARENLIVCRTFSKCYALAALRVGYAIAPPDLTDFLNRVREPFNCNSLGQVAALASLRDEEFVARSVKSNRAGRELLQAGLDRIGIEYIPSQTNFLLVNVSGETEKTGADWYDAMLRRGVIIRPVGVYGLRDHVRISIGTEEETARCVEALEQTRDAL